MRFRRFPSRAPGAGVSRGAPVAGPAKPAVAYSVRVLMSGDRPCSTRPCPLPAVSASVGSGGGLAAERQARARGRCPSWPGPPGATAAPPCDAKLAPPPRKHRGHRGQQQALQLIAPASAAAVVACPAQRSPQTAVPLRRRRHASRLPRWASSPNHRASPPPALTAQKSPDPS